MASVRKKTWKDKKGKTRFSWCVEWRNAEGKSKVKCSREWSEEDAKAYRREIEGRKAKGQRTEVAERWTAGAWMRDYARRAHQGGISGYEPVGAARRDQLQWVARCVEEDPIGDMLLEGITEVEMRRFQSRLLGGKLQRKSAKEVLTSFKAALDDARRQGMILNDVWQDVKIVHNQRRKRRKRRTQDDGDDYLEMPTPEQVRTLLDTAKGLRDDTARTMGWEPVEDATWRQYHASEGPRGWKNTQQAWKRNYVFVLLAVLTGLRQGEIRALYKRDVKLDRGVLSVLRAADVDNNIKEPKSETGIRDVPIPPQLEAELRGWLEIAPESRFLFPSRNGGLMDRSNVYHRVWCRLLEHAGMGDVNLSFHSLRHFYASSIIEAGMNPKQVMETMGHSSIQVTFDLYGHRFDRDMKHIKAAACRSADTLLGS
jgi:integrase